MRVIIEIPSDANYLDITVTRVWIEKETKEPCLDTMHRGYDVNDLEIVHESCVGCKYIGNIDEDAKCDECKLFQYWEAKDETNT